jgi:hypothetical protein
LHTPARQQEHCSEHPLPVDECAVPAAEVHNHVSNGPFVCGDDLQVSAADQVIGFVIPYIALPVTAEDNLALRRQQKAINLICPAAA